MREEIYSEVCKPMRWALIATCIALPGLLNRADAQVAPSVGTFVQITGPALANPGEHLSFCFQKVEFKYTSQNPVDVGHSLVKGEPGTATLRIVDAVTGAEKARKDITLPVEGSPALPPDPCVKYVVPAVSASSFTTSILSPTPAASAPAIYIGVVSVSSQTLPPGVAPVSSLDIFTPIFGIPTNIRHVSNGPTCPPGEYPCVY
jgi:hypothetical protein